MVPEVSYSPHAAEGDYNPRLDLVLFLNGIPIVTLELKSEFKQAVESANRQYKKTGLPKDPTTNKPEPLLTFKRGALVHFAVSQYEVVHDHASSTARTPSSCRSTRAPRTAAPATRPAGHQPLRHRLPVAARSSPPRTPRHHRALHPPGDRREEDWDGRKYKRDADLPALPPVGSGQATHRAPRAPKARAQVPGPAQRRLRQVQLHRLDGAPALLALQRGRDQQGLRLRHRGHGPHRARQPAAGHHLPVRARRGVVGRINRDEGQGSKSEKLAEALAEQHAASSSSPSRPSRTCSRRSKSSATSKERRYAIIADEAHSSQSGSTAGKLKEVLTHGSSSTKKTSRSARRTCWPPTWLPAAPTEQLQLLRLHRHPQGQDPGAVRPPPNPDEPAVGDEQARSLSTSTACARPSRRSFILDVLKNYTTYKVAYQLAQKAAARRRRGGREAAKSDYGQWVRLHEYNIAQKVQVIVEHFRDNVAGLLGGHAKAMIVTGSRKEAVRYKLGSTSTSPRRPTRTSTPWSPSPARSSSRRKTPIEELPGDSTEQLNPGLKGRDMRKAFDTEDYTVMIVAQKFQTGFDQPKLCAMYVDKKLGASTACRRSPA